MSKDGIRAALTVQDLALHDTGELLPFSGALLQEDIATGRVVMTTGEYAPQVTEILDQKPAE